jgi:carbonic anhydrase
MRTTIVFLAGLLAFSHGVAADNLIRLSKPLDLQIPAKDAEKSDASGKEVIKTEISDESKAPVPSPLTAAQKEEKARKDAAVRDQDLGSQQDVADKIKARLAALREKNAGNKIQPKPIPYVNRNSIQKSKPGAKGKGKEPAKEMTAQNQEEHPIHWSYEGNDGPAKWSKLTSAWAQCEKGKRQSPIDIHDGIKVDLEQIKFEYKPVHFKVTDNGHTVQVDLEAGNRITLTGKSYELLQFHFHRPSEERINGKSFQMVTHLVHKSEDGKLAVVALLVDEGVANSIIQNVWNNLPLEKNEAVVPLDLLDVNQLLPMAREYYTYMGSLTTPPCTEGVLWLVMRQPIQLSPQQIGIFARLYPMNARPIQTNDGRMIKESN